MEGITPTPLTIVSNRLPMVPSGDASRGWRLNAASGGLVTALDPILRQHGGSWVGWDGMEQATPQSILDAFARESDERGYSLIPIHLAANRLKGYYHGAANRIIWPLFHNMLGNCTFSPDYWQEYREVNRQFARVTLERASPSDLIWVQDYHLLLMGAELRQLGWRGRLGHFLHIPFPSLDTFMTLPWRREVVDAMLDFDVLGFQTPRDRDNFLACVSHLVGPVNIPEGDQHCVVPEEVMRCKRSNGNAHPQPVTVGAFPISIDVKAIEARAESQAVQEMSQRLRNELRCEKLIFDATRLDYSKGLPERLRAFRHLLRSHPELHERVTLVQYVVPGRTTIPEYHDMHQQIERMVSEINGEFTVPGWIPVHYVYRSLNPTQMTAYFKAADIALNTPLKDGMNLVAKEFCAARTDDDGVLILSEQAGAAEELRCGALTVNPFDTVGMADALYAACKMPAAERQRRMRAMRRVVQTADIYHWLDDYLGVLSGTQPPRGESPNTGETRPLVTRLDPQSKATRQRA